MRHQSTLSKSRHGFCEMGSRLRLLGLASGGVAVLVAPAALVGESTASSALGQVSLHQARAGTVYIIWQR
jgi:hypothetical protein